MLRIVAGKHRGRKIKRPPETITRPTMDRVRESIFNILTYGEWGGERYNAVKDAIVLDAFAGSGALGIECLSQGAKFVYFFDKNPAPLRIIRENVDHVGEQDNAAILFADATRPPKPRAAATLVLLDPPFGKNLTALCLPPLLVSGWIAPDAVIVAEIEADQTLAVPETLEVIKHRVYGTTQVFFMMQRAALSPAGPLTA